MGDHSGGTVNQLQCPLRDSRRGGATLEKIINDVMNTLQPKHTVCQRVHVRWTVWPMSCSIVHCRPE